MKKYRSAIKKLPSIAILAVLLFLALSPRLGRAATEVYADAFSPLGISIPAVSARSGTVDQEQVGSYLQNGTVPLSILARARASFGELGVHGEAHFGQMPHSSIYAVSTAYFKDDLTIDAPGLTGQSGFCVFKLHIDGTLTSQFKAAGSESVYFALQSYAKATLKVSQDGSDLRDDSEYQFGNGNHTITGLPFLNQEIVISAPIIFGTPFELKVYLSVTANSRSEFGADSTADLWNTARWGGITSVTDSGAGPVPNFSAISASSTNYIPAISTPLAIPPQDIFLALSGEIANLTWISDPGTALGTLYQVEHSLTPGGYLPVGAPTAGTTAMVPIGNAPRSFFRISARLP